MDGVGGCGVRLTRARAPTPPPRQARKLSEQEGSSTDKESQTLGEQVRAAAPPPPPQPLLERRLVSHLPACTRALWLVILWPTPLDSLPRRRRCARSCRTCIRR